ncbi:MAG: protein kinase [Acidimicrobiales bacterium]|nr:protein kinase [Acidimicrobiales bacterium]
MAYVPAGVPGVEDLVEVGRGGFSVVYRGRQPDLGRDVAVKVVSSGGSGADLERWRREIVAMARLTNHPNILAVYSAGVTDDGSPYLVMPYVPGGSLHDRVKAQGPIAPEEVAVLGAKLAGALASAHAAGVLHRDVKPENVLLSPYGEPQLTDFGIARLLDSTATASGKVHATIPYAAPEVLAGFATEAADVYGLGATLHAVLVGAPPFTTREDESLVAFVGRIVHTPAPDLRSAGVPAELASVIEGALVKDPKDRTPTADQLRACLEEIIPILAAAPEPAVAPSVFALDAPRDPPTERLAPEPAVAAAVDEPPTPSRPRASALGVLVGLIARALLALVVALALRDDADPTASTGTTAAATTDPADDPATDPTEAPGTTATPAADAGEPSGDEDGEDGEEPEGAGAAPGETASTYFERIAAGNLDSAYGMLSPDFRAVQSRESYGAFWGGFDSVEVAGAPTVAGDGRRVTVPLRLDGRAESFTLTLAPRGNGGWWIDGPRPG